MNIAIITARGGSKRIPRKNIKEFCGQPIIKYSIDAALNSGVFDEVMVSTDDDEIASIAKAFGANVPFLRTEKTSNDYATTADVLNEVLSEYKKKGKRFDTMCCLYPTAPFVSAKRLRYAFEKLQVDSNADLVMPVVEYGYPPQRGFVETAHGGIEYWMPEYKNSRSQDLPSIFHDAGQFYFYRLCDGNTFKSEIIIPLRISEMEAQDIDNETDWKLAEIKYKHFSFEGD